MTLVSLTGCFIWLSCGAKKYPPPKTWTDIDVDRLFTACDCVHAWNLVYSEQLVISENWDSLDSKNYYSNLDTISKLADLIDHIDSRCYAEMYVPAHEIYKCAEYDEMKKNMDKLKQVEQPLK